MRLVWILGSTALLGLGLAAGCSDDDDDPATGTGGNGGAAGAPTGGGPTTGGAPATGGNGGLGGLGGMGGVQGLACDPTGDAACENAEDCVFVVSGQLQETTAECGGECLGDTDVQECALDCVTEELGASEECSTCYVELAACTTEECFAECALDQQSEDCQECLDDNDCTSEFETCSGLTLN